jgi:ligand-binding sensor domain-containing protein
MKKFLLFVIPFSLLTIMRLDAQVWTNYTTSNSGLSYNQVLSAAVDGSGIKWFGTNGGGVNKFDGANWTVYRKNNSNISNSYIYVVKPDNQGTIWAGNNSGLSEFDGTSWTNYTNNGTEDFTVYAIDFDSQGNKWLGASIPSGWGVISKFDGINFTNYYKVNGISISGINAVAKDSQGNMWFGSSDGLVCSFNGSGWTDHIDAIYNATGESPGFVSAITADVSGTIWIGANNGAYKKSAGGWTRFTSTNSGLCYDGVYSIAIDQQSHVWFGTGNGVSEFDGTNWTTYTTAEGLVDEQVYSVAIDQQGSKWFATKEGISWLHNNTDIGETSTTKELSVYPNPATDKITFEVNEPGNTIINFGVYNSHGQRIFVKQATDNKIIINVADFPTGIYFVKITTCSGVLVARFCKQ